MKNYLSILLIPLFIVGCLESPTEPEIPEEPEIFKLNHIYSLVDGMFVFNLDLPNDENGFSRARFALASSDVETSKDLILLNGVLEKETMACFIDLVYDEIAYNKTICLQLTK